MVKRQKSIFYSILTISLVSFLSKIIGFIREGVVAAYFGTTAETDIFFLAYSFYSVLTVIIGGSIGISYLPIFVKDTENKGLDKSLRYASKIVNQIFIVSLILSIVIYIFASKLSILIAPDFSESQIIILSKYIRFLSFSLFFTVVIYLLISILNGQKKYGVPQLTGLLYSIVTISIVGLFHNSLGLDSLLYSVIISAVLQFIILIFLVFKNKKQYVFRPEFRNPESLKLYYLIIPVFLGTGTLYLSQLIDKIIASTLGPGSVSALYYSGVLHSVINTLLISSLVTVFYTDISQKYANGDIKKVVHSWQQGISILILLLVPLTVILFANSIDIVHFIFERGKFTNESTQLTSLAFSFYILGCVFFGIRNLSTRLFYVIGDTKTPMINGCISLILNTILAYILSLYFNISGITLASVITSVITCIWLIYILNKKIPLNIKILYPIILKVLISAALMFLSIILIKNAVSFDYRVLKLLISSIAGIFVYLLGLVIMKCTEVKYVLNIIMLKLKK